MMSQAIQERSSYGSAFADWSKAEGDAAPGWLKARRERAIESFERRGFPTTGVEDWKYTSLAALARENFNPAGNGAGGALSREVIAPFVYEESRHSRLVFVDGFFRPELSSLEEIAEGVVASDLLAALGGEHAEFIRGRIEGAAVSGADSFHDLNTAFLSGGAFILVGRGVRVASPIQLLFLSSASETASFPRVLVVADEDSSATLIESYAALGGGNYFTNAVIETVVGGGARINHYKAQTEGEGAYHVASTKVEVGRGGAYDLTSINLGARLSRHNIEVRMGQEGGECWVDGLYLLGDGQHHDTHSLIDHLVPRCNSHQNYKGILDGRSRAVFNGRVFVHPDAQQTDAFQSNKNLLLSPEARVDTKPQLEIFADDVKCAHGATVGQLEEEELFYLVSRGLNPRLARNLLTYGFAEEIVGKIKVDSIRKQLDGAILNRLHADFGA